VHIAAALYDITREDTPQPSQSEIARTVGISRAALSEYLLKRKRKEEKEQKEEGRSSQEKEQEDKTPEKALKNADKFIASLEKLYDEYPHTYTQVIQKLFPVVVDGLSTIHADDNDKTYQDSIAVLLTSHDDFTSANIPYIGKLARVLVGASKKLEKQYPVAKETVLSSEKQEKSS
jgi:predicted transcriptional regulator